MRGRPGPARMFLLAGILLLATLVGCLGAQEGAPGDPRTPEATEPGDAETAPERWSLQACDEQFGVFTIPASQAEPYLPEGFEPTGIGSDPLPEGRATLIVLILPCQQGETGETVTQFWVHLLVDPPPAYDREDAAFKYVPVELGVTNATLLDAFHAWGIPQATLADVEVEVEATAPGVESWRTTASTGNGSAVLATETVGYHPEAVGAVARMYGVEDGELVGIVDFEATAWQGGLGAATFENRGLVPLDVDEAGSGGVALDYDVVLTPVELAGGG